MLLMKNFFLLPAIVMVTEKITFYFYDNQISISNHAGYQSKLSLTKWSQKDKVYSREIVKGEPCTP